jgi:hypothetical protein
MVENNRPRPSAIAFARNAVLLFCLLAPSAWLLTTVPPLWRDADAYVQLTEDPLIVTFWGHAPAYSYVAKPLLFAGEQWERSRSDTSSSLPRSSQPRLTDTGVWLVIICQHLGLVVASFWFIRAVTKSFWARLALALAWTSNPLFYTYAHCLGSESLSLILIIVLATVGLRLIQSRRNARWTHWYAFAVILTLCILSRDLNLGLLSLLPAGFLLLWARYRASTFCVSAQRVRHGLQRLRAKYFRHAVIAIAIGLACVLVADSLKNNLARKTKLHPHSRIGFTFLWRLSFLDDLSPEARSTLLRKVASRTQSIQARRLIALLEQMHTEKADMSSGSFMSRAILLFDGPKWEELDLALNQVAFAFLLPPTPEHLQATKKDLLYALDLPPTEITAYLFATTAFYFGHEDSLPQYASLLTFRGVTADQITSIPSQHLYFRLWQGLNYYKVFLFWLLVLAALILLARRKRTSVSETTAYGIALTAVGLLICTTACVLHECEPRFALTLWQMLLLSLYLFLGKTVDLLRRESPPGSHCRPEP